MTELQQFIQLVGEFRAALAVLIVEIHRTRNALDSFADACCLNAEQGQAAAQDAAEAITRAKQ